MSLKLNSKKDSKKVFRLGLAALTSCFILSGCGIINNSTNNSQNLKSIVYCKPSSYKNGRDSYELILAKDGKTIEQYTGKQSINGKFVHEAVKYRNAHGENITEKEVYQEFVSLFRKQYDNWTKNNKKVPWMSAILSEKPDKYEATLTITFDFTSKNYFPNQETLDFLYGFMPTEYFYNEDEQKMEYQKGVIEKNYTENGLDIGCENQKIDYDDTLHAKVITQVKDVAKKSKDKK